MIPNLQSQRAAITAALPDMVVYDAVPTGALPRGTFLILGMPAWRAPSAAVGMATVTWSVYVLQPSDGTEPAADAAALERAWPEVLLHLDSATEQDPSLGGVCITSSVTGSSFDPLTIRGQEYPAQAVTLELLGA